MKKLSFFLKAIFCLFSLFFICSFSTAKNTNTTLQELLLDSQITLLPSGLGFGTTVKDLMEKDIDFEALITDENKPPKVVVKKIENKAGVNSIICGFSDETMLLSSIVIVNHINNIDNKALTDLKNSYVQKMGNPEIYIEEKKSKKTNVFIWRVNKVLVSFSFPVKHIDGETATLISRIINDEKIKAKYIKDLNKS